MLISLGFLALSLAGESFNQCFPNEFSRNETRKQ